MTGFDRRHRLLVPELMDTETLSPAELRHCLCDLRRLNRLTLGTRPTLQWLDTITRDLPRDRVLSLVDLGCGAGDTLRAIAAWARRRGRVLQLHGVDLNPVTIDIARQHADGIAYSVGDAIADMPAADLIVNTLFMHHLNDAQARTMLARMHAQARIGWLVSDLHRHAISYWGLRVITKLLRLHRVVQHDGPVSVARGWRAAELRALAPTDRICLRWQLPFRWAMSGP